MLTSTIQKPNTTPTPQQHQPAHNTTTTQGHSTTNYSHQYHQGQHGHDTQKPNSAPSITITVPNHHNTTNNTLAVTIHHPHNQTIMQTNEQHIFTGQSLLPRKEVIQPHLPVRLPCYDFIPDNHP
jgi:hypothetical protein